MLDRASAWTDASEAGTQPPECTDLQYYDEASNTCIQCGENCLNCADETGACETCKPANEAGHFAIDSNDHTRCDFHAKEEPEAATHATTRRKQEHEQGTDDAHEDRVSECVFDVHKRTSVVLPSPLMTMRSAPGKSAKSTINKASSPCWVWPIQTLSPASSNASAVTVNSSPLLTALIP